MKHRILTPVLAIGFIPVAFAIKARGDLWGQGPDWFLDNAKFTMSVALADLDNDTLFP